MSGLSFHFGTDLERKPNVLTWRLPKRFVAPKPTVLKPQSHKKPCRVFGRRTALSVLGVS